MPRPGTPSAPARLLVAGAIALALAAVAFWAGPARAAGTRVCDGYDACSATGYPSHGYGAHAETSYWMMSAGDQCTNYTAYVEQTVYGVKPPGYTLGDGGVWAQTAAEHGVVVDHTPTVGAVAEWDDGTAGIGGPGHVGVVERVGWAGDHIRWIDISQQHIDEDTDGYDWERIYAHSSSSEWEPWPSNFIHFSGAPTRARLLAMYGGTLYRLGGMR
jgi:hypothetical protein